MRLTIVLDGQDLSVLVPFWCAALDYEAAFSLPDFEVLAPAANAAAAAGGDAAPADAGTADAWTDADPTAAADADADAGADMEATGPAFILQRVPEPKAGKNRMHVDIHPPLELGVPALVARLEALGGRRLGEPVTGLLESLGIWWQTMADPEGNEFDVVADPGHPPVSEYLRI